VQASERVRVRDVKRERRNGGSKQVDESVDVAMSNNATIRVVMSL
jgi:hypothetical protein